jgi:outer membrane receptor for ferrienterochelin and colicins
MRRYALSAILALAWLGANRSAAAEEDTSDLEGLLDTSVVSAASKSAESVSIAPATSIVITAEELRRYGIRTIDEAINFLAFGMVTEKKFQSSEIGARGVLLANDFGGHVLLMVDGHVLNEPWGATAYFDRSTAVPLEIVDHIEIVLGPGSVLYGANAMLGIVHIVTKRAKDFPGVRVIVESEVPTSLRGAMGLGKEFTLFGSDGEVVFELEHYRQQGPVFKFGPQVIETDPLLARRYDSDPDNPNPPGVWGGKGDDAYLTEVPAAYLRLRLGDLEVGARAAIAQRTAPTDGGNFDDPEALQQDRWLHLDVKHSLPASASVRLSTRLYGDLYDYHEYWPSNGADDCLEGQDEGCLWLLKGAAQMVGLEPQLTLDWFEDGRAVTLIGLDGKIKHIQSSVDFIDNGSGESPGKIGAYDPTEKALAAYLQQTVWPAEWLALNAGARFDVDDRFGSHFSPRAALALLPWRGGTAKLMYAEAFRAPSAFDIYYYDPATQLPGGKDLRPEIVRSVEATIEQRAGAQTIQIGAFRSWWEDLLLSQELSEEEFDAALASGELAPTATYAYQVRNVSSIESYGMNLAYEGSLSSGRLRYGLSFTEAIARRKDPGAPEGVLEVAPQLFGNARISYDLGPGLPTAALATRYVGPRLITDGTYADPAVEMRATLSGEVPPMSGLSYRLTANYITAARGAYVVGPGLLEDGRHEHVPNDQFRIGVGLAYVLPL